MSTSGPAEPEQPNPSRGWQHIDPATLMRIKHLELRARAVVEGFLSGLHRSPYHGFSVEFTEYREYSPGDDLRFLDWRLLARSDRYYLKRFVEETNLRCYLLVDLSRSMAYHGPGRTYAKAEYAKTVAATLAYFLNLQRDAVGLMTFDQSIRDYLPARFRPGHLHRMLVQLERAPAGTDTDLGLPLEQIARTVRKRGVVILISDLLAPLDELETKLGYLRSQGHEVTLLRILDPAELDFPYQEESLFLDLESGRELYIDPAAARAGYQERFQAHAQQLAQLCANQGLDLFDLRTDEPLDRALFDLLSARLRRGRPTSRRTGMARSARGGR